jgi:hypothetical protein
MVLVFKNSLVVGSPPQAFNLHLILMVRRYWPPTPDSSRNLITIKRRSQNGRVCVQTKNAYYRAQSYVNIKAHLGCLACEI